MSKENNAKHTGAEKTGIEDLPIDDAEQAETKGGAGTAITLDIYANKPRP